LPANFLLYYQNEVKVVKKNGILDDNDMKFLLNEIMDKYREILKDKIVEIILFGSYARKNQEEYSDVDIMVLVDDTDENIRNVENEFGDFNHELLLKYEVFVSPILVSFAQFKEYRDILPFFMNADKEGIRIYERKAA
jgi:uncharacterized protein